MVAFQPTRGIIQGDPLSPYIFTLCMEYLVGLINHAVHRNKWSPIYISKQSPPISHLFFADDIILFAEFNEATIQTINDCLNYFVESPVKK